MNKSSISTFCRHVPYLRPSFQIQKIQGSTSLPRLPVSNRQDNKPNQIKEQKTELLPQFFNISTSTRSPLPIPHPLRDRTSPCAFQFPPLGILISDTPMHPDRRPIKHIHLIPNDIISDRQAPDHTPAHPPPHAAKPAHQADRPGTIT